MTKNPNVGGRPRSPDDSPEGGDGSRRNAGGGGGASIPEVQNEARLEAHAGRARGDTGGSDEPGDAGARPADADSRPPWPVADGVPGLDKYSELLPPNARHTVSGVRSGQVDTENTVILRGYESEVRRDIQGIAEGRGRWNPAISRFEINGRTYGIEGTGRMYPDSGPGLVKLDRNEYMALKEWLKADGDASRSKQFQHAPRFLNNPEAVQKAKEIYDGTYE